MLELGPRALPRWDSLSPEFRLGVFRGDNLLTDLLQRGHPTCRQVAVLKDHPGPVLDGFVDHFGSNRALALAKGDGLCFGASHANIICKLQQT